MTTNTLGLFFFGRPFVGVDMYLADGRVVTVGHPETAVVGEHGTAVFVIDDAGRSEVIDTALIVPCRTHRPAFDFA